MISLYDILLEALEDDIPEYQKNAISSKQSDYLKRDYKKIDFIEDVKLQIEDTDKKLVIDVFFDFNKNSISNLLKQFTASLGDEEMFKQIFKMCQVKDFNIDFSNIYLSDINFLLSNNFHTVTMIRDISKIPEEYRKDILTIGDKNIKVNKNQITNINTFIDSFNKAFSTNIDNIFVEKEFSTALSNLKDVDFAVEDLLTKPLYLYISGKPSDILNMSISKFYDSCQNLYSGGYRRQLLSNVFDRNMKVCYLIFDIEWADEESNVHNFMPFCRTILRNFDKEVFIDRAYPDRMRKPFISILNKYIDGKKFITKTKKDYKVYQDDIGDLDYPYMDNLSIQTVYSNLQNYDLKELRKIFKRAPEFYKSVDRKDFTEKFQKTVIRVMSKDSWYMPKFLDYIKNPSQEAVMLAYKYNPLAFKYFKNPTDEQKTEAVDRNGLNIRYIKNPSKEMERNAVIQDSDSIQYIKNPSEELQKIAVQDEGENIRYIKNPSYKLMKLAVKNNWAAIEYIKNPSEELQMIAVTDDEAAIEYIDNSTEKIIKYAIKDNTYLLRYVKNQSEDIQKFAIGLDADAIEYINNPSEEMQLLALKKSQTAFKYIKKPTIKVIWHALELDGGNIKYVKKATQEMKMFVVKNDPWVISRIEFPNEELQLAAVNINPNVIEVIKAPKNSVQIAAVTADKTLIKKIVFPCEKAIAIAKNKKPKKR